jgi:hypothetical protein
VGPIAKITSFGAILAVVFAAATFAGARLDPDVSEPAGHADDEAMAMGGHESGGESVPGLAVAAGGFRLVPESTDLPADPAAEIEFQIVDDAGEPVTDFDVEHERRMHLIVVRRDFERFQHLHPRMSADGTWSATADLRAPGAYRVFADFAARGEAATLATDAFVAGPFEPRRLPEPELVAHAGDGYEVTIDTAEPVPGGVTDAEFTVSRNGRELDGVEPYLGADGHLVALRDHDLAFLHTHPEGEAGGPGPIRFGIEYPTPGKYRLFLQFKHRGEVHTGAFTQEVGDGH